MDKRERNDIFRVLDEETLKNSKKDVRSRSFLFPKRILWTAGQVENSRRLLEKEEMQISLAAHEPCILKNEKGEKASILLDYGIEIHGGISLLAWLDSTKRGAKVRVRFGESAAEAMSELGGKTNATNDHARRDLVVEVGMMSMNPIGETGFRFVRIDLLEPEAVLVIKSICAVMVYKDVPYRGSFSCSDPLLNRIWDVGAYTVHLNMQEYLWDGIKRDRLVWLGDMHPEVMTVNTVFGYNEVVPKSLDLIRDVTPLPAWMNGISAYSIWWLLIQRDWYYHHGDVAYLKEQQTYMSDLLRLLISKVDADGREKLDGWRFMDWPSSENQVAIDAGLQSLVLMAMRAGDELCTTLGDDVLASQCRETAKKMEKAAPKVIKPLLKSKIAPDAPGSKQGAALLALAGLMKPEEANSKYLSVGGARGFSTFYGYYMLRAMAAAGNYQGAIDVIRQYWGAMIDLGATTFWEDFNMDWLPNAARIDELVPEGKKDIHGDYGDYCYKGFRHSLCHGWASGPTSWLSEYVLGVQVVEPGCRAVRITPHLGDLKWVEGTFPTPQGVITIRHEKGADGKVKSEVKAPDGVKVYLEN